jgi:hypothetical protein
MATEEDDEKDKNKMKRVGDRNSIWRRQKSGREAKEWRELGLYIFFLSTRQDETRRDGTRQTLHNTIHTPYFDVCFLSHTPVFHHFRGRNGNTKTDIKD